MKDDSVGDAMDGVIHNAVRGAVYGDSVEGAVDRAMITAVKGGVSK
jgi:hypothetical protein